MRAPCLLLAALLAAPAAAQTSQPVKPAGDDAAQDRAAGLLQKLTYDAKLLGTIRMGLYFNSKNLGSMVLTITKADPKSGAVYKAQTVASMTFGPAKNGFTETVWLDAALSMVKLEGEQEETDPHGAVSKRTKRIEQKGGQWSLTATHVDGKGNRTEETLTAPLKGANHWNIAGLMLLARKLDLKTPGSYQLAGLKWPELTRGGWSGDGAAAWGAVTVVVPKPTQRSIRGAARQVLRVKVTRAGEANGAQHLLLAPDGAFLGVEAEAVPIKMLVGTAEQIKQDLDEGADAKAVKAAVRTWFQVLVKKKKPAALDPIVDWEAFATARKLADPSLKAKTTMELAAEAKQTLAANQDLIDDEVLKSIDMALKTTIKGANATVSLRGMGGPSGGPTWKLQKTGKTWKLVEFPLDLK